MAYMRGDWDRGPDDRRPHATRTRHPRPRAMLESVGARWSPPDAARSSALSRLPALRERWHREGMIAVVGGGAAIELLSMRDGAAAAVATYDDICARARPAVGRAASAPGCAWPPWPSRPWPTRRRARRPPPATRSGPPPARLVADAERVARGPRGGRAAVRDRGPGLGGPAARGASCGSTGCSAAASTSTTWSGAGARPPSCSPSWATPTRRPGRAPGWPPSCGRRVTPRPAQEEAAAARERGAAGWAPRRCSRSSAASRRAERDDGDCSPRASARSSRWWPPGAATARSASSCSSPAKTVSVHVSNVMAKLGAASRTEAVCARPAGGTPRLSSAADAGVVQVSTTRSPGT